MASEKHNEQEYEESLLSFQKALEKATSVEQIIRALLNKGITLGELGRLGEGIEVFEELIRDYQD